MGSSVFAIHAISFFAPERRSQTARGLREDSDGRTRRRRSVTEAAAPCWNHRFTKPERKSHTSGPSGTNRPPPRGSRRDSRGSTSNVKRSSSRPSAKRQVISSGLTTSITIRRLPVRRSTTISPRCGMGHLHRLLEQGMRNGTAGGRPPLLRCFERLLCSRLRFEQLAPHVEERPTDEHGGPEQDESSNDGHRDRYAGKPRDEAHAFTTNITHGHGGLLKRGLTTSRRFARARPLGTRRIHAADARSPD